ncbi:hypothetical protein GOP47_0024571 [Adiantum capillus-veneris]|uniref:AAA+ ATPase domain-containing protein n=1 Tax=Adiantum capillus-veneris TaxID=13818 RepID=A0A9D4U4Q2_ADICA|nr:hypothetical protein GOP47_0024571 [Adiantum capillus-veneris]
MYRSSRSTPSLLKHRSLCGQRGREKILHSNAALLANGLHSLQSDTSLLTIGVHSLCSSPFFAPAAYRHSYALSKYLSSPHFWHHSLRHFCRSCDEDIDKKSSPLASADAGKDEIDESKKVEAIKADCELPSESESTRRSRSKESQQEQILAVPPTGENAQENQEVQQEDFGGKPPDNEKKKGNGKVNPLKMKFKKMLISWDKIHETFDNFPYYLNEHTKDLLIESAAAQLWHHKQTKFGNSLRTSSRLVLLTGPPGTEIYQEKLVRALAKNLKASLLILDSDVLAAKQCKPDTHDTSTDLGGDTGIIPPEGGEIWTINTTDDEDGNDDEESSSKKAVSAGPSLFQTLGLMVKQREKPKAPKVAAAAAVHVTKSDDDDTEEEESQSDAIQIGDHVRFIDSKASKGAKKRASPRVGQQGLVMSVTKELPGEIGVKFERASSRKAGGSSKENRSFVFVCNVKQLEKVDAKCPEEVPWMAPIEAFAGLGPSPGGTIVYFPDLEKWMAKAVSKEERNFFLHTLADHLDSSKGPVLFITGRRMKVTGVNNEREDLHGVRSFLSSMRVQFRKACAHLKGTADVREIEELFDIFKNVVPILPPQDNEALRQWREQLDQDKKELQLRNNVAEIEKVLSANSMRCKDVVKVDFSDLLLTEKQAQKIVGWARNIFLNLNEVQPRGKTLSLSRESLELAVTRFRAIETPTDKLGDIKSLAENSYERELLSSVVRAKDIGVSFEQIGALEDVKTTLKELIILPLKRPELFNKGNLRKPCKGVLLFGPPGTGKTLLAKAVATEAGANFMSISASSLTCKYFGESEKLAKSLFTLARKLEPAIIFIDEVDGILRARGDENEHEASRRVRNELMAAWDGLQTKDRERILVLATTNRPFDLDDAVIRRLPRRIFIDLPNATNREKILHKLLVEEDLSKDFDYEVLAAQTEGFSGSDLKNLCVAAAYRPIQEFLEAEKQGIKNEFVNTINSPKDRQVSLRPLCLDDFIQAKVKVGLSVAYDASSMVQIRKWNEQFGEGGSRLKSSFGFIK